MTPLTSDFVADEFLAAAYSAGLRKVTVQVGKIVDGLFLVTVTMPNPVSVGDDDQYLASSGCYEFLSGEDIADQAARQAKNFAITLPTIH